MTAPKTGYTRSADGTNLATKSTGCQWAWFDIEVDATAGDDDTTARDTRLRRALTP